MKYICATCNEEFTSDWSNEEAMKEAKELWGDSLGSNPAVICDDCFGRGIANIN